MNKETGRNIRKHVAGFAIPVIITLGGAALYANTAIDLFTRTRDSKSPAIEIKVQQEIPGFSSEEFNRLQRTVADFKKATQTQIDEQIPTGNIRIDIQVPQDVMEANNTLSSKNEIFDKGNKLVLRRKNKNSASSYAMKLTGGTVLFVTGFGLTAKKLEHTIQA